MSEILEKRNKNLIKSVFTKMLLPALAAGASANLAGMIDGVIVGNKLGTVALGAINACRPAMQIYGFMSEILASGLVSCIAIAMGRNEKKSADRIFTSGVLFAAIIAVFLTAVQFIFAPGICRLFANDVELYSYALEYFRIFLFGFFFIILGEPLASAMRADGMPGMSGMVLLLPHIVNALMDVIFVYGLELGMKGAAIATVIGYVAGFLPCCYYFFFKRSYRLTGGDFGKNLADITSTGLPLAVNMGLISIKLLIVNSLVLTNGGSVGMAVMSILMTAWALQSLFIGGVKQSTMPLISFYYSNGDYHGVRAVFSHAFKVLMGAVLTLSALLVIFPKILPLLYGMRNAEELAVAVVALRIFAIYLPLEAFIMLVITYYTATGNKKTALLVSTLQGLGGMVIVIFPLAYFFGLIGVWISFAVSCLVPIGVIAIACHGNIERFFKMKGHTYLKELSLDFSDISDIVASVIEAVQIAGFDKDIANRTGIAIEEMAVSAFERNKDKKLNVDVTVRKIDDLLLVTFVDNGVEFNPLQCDTASGPDDINNISMLKAISHKIEYGRVVGMNKTDIVLK